MTLQVFYDPYKHCWIMIQKWSSQHFGVIIVLQFQSFHGRDFFLQKFETTRERWLSWFILIIHLVFRVTAHNNLLIVAILPVKQIFKLKYILWNYHGKNIKNLNPQRRKTLCYSTKLPREIQFEYLHLCSTLLFCSLHNPYHRYMPLRTKQIIWVSFSLLLKKITEGNSHRWQ